VAVRNTLSFSDGGLGERLGGNEESTESSDSDASCTDCSERAVAETV
jgi:hypothetical protein